MLLYPRLSLSRSAVFAVFCALVLFAPTAPLHAQDAPQPQTSVSPQMEAAIVELLAQTGAMDMVDQTMNQMFTAMEPMLRQSMPSLTDAQFETFASMLAEEMDTAAYQAMYVQIYARHFTLEEIRGMIAFNETPLGASILAKTPLVMQESFEGGQRIGQQAGRRAAERFLAQIQAEEAEQSVQPKPARTSDPNRRPARKSGGS